MQDEPSLVAVDVPYSRKICREIKFDCLAVYFATTKLKSANISYLHNYIFMAILYQTTKFNMFAMAIWDLTTNLIPTNISGYTVCTSQQHFKGGIYWMS